MELIVQIAAIALAIMGAIFLFEAIKSKVRSEAVDKFNQQRAEALALDEEVKKLKQEVIRDTADFNAKLRLHRAKYGKPSSSKSTDNSNEPL